MLRARRVICPFRLERGPASTAGKEPLTGHDIPPSM
jgi:hypothetical protein